MADKSEQEPSIEDILASIRQIISDDDTEAAPAPAPPPEPTKPAPAAKAPEPPPAPPKAAAPLPPPPVIELRDEEEDVLELTDPVVEEVKAPAPSKPRTVEIEMRQHIEDEAESVLTDSAASAAMTGFARLARNAPIDNSGTGQVTLEEIVKEMMKPMLRDWLDQNLPSLIEKIVQKELEKVARAALDG
jgi:cell pole-organizing protein PopZ